MPNVEDSKFRAYCQYYLRRSQTGGALQYFHGGQHQYGKGLGSMLAGFARSVIPTVLPIITKGATHLVKNTLSAFGGGQDFGSALKGSLPPTGKMMLRSGVRAAKKKIAPARGGKRRRQAGKGLAIMPASRPRVYKGYNPRILKRKAAPKRRAIKRSKLSTFSNF